MSLTGLGGEEIRQKLNAERLDLEQQIKQLRADKVSGNAEEMKIARLQLMWVIYAQSWAKLKFPREDELNPPAPREHSSTESNDEVNDEVQDHQPQELTN